MSQKAFSKKMIGGLSNYDKMLKTKEVLSLLSISRNTLKKYINNGIVPPPLQVFHAALIEVFKSVKSATTAAGIHRNAFYLKKSDG